MSAQQTTNKRASLVGRGKWDGRGEGKAGGGVSERDGPRRVLVFLSRINLPLGRRLAGRLRSLPASNAVVW